MASGSADSSTGTTGGGSGNTGRPRKQRKRPRSQSSASATLEDQATKLQEEDFTCPICFNLFEEVYSTVCGHSFCYRCVRRMLMQSPHCPICKAGLPPQNPIHPNFSLNDLVTKYKLQKVGSAKRRCNSDEGRRLLEAVSSASDEDLPKALEMIQERLRKKEERGVGVNYHILLDFFLESKRRKEKELTDVKQQLEVIQSDIEDLKSRDEGLSVDQEEATRRKVRVHGNFEELLADYLSRRVPCIQGYSNSEGGEGEGGGEDQPQGDGGGGGEDQPQGDRPYEGFAETLEQFTRFSGWREVSSLNYGDQSNACSIVSSIEFDRDGEVFAVGGVTKKIKIYSFANLLESATRFHTHFPICEMTCQAKLSSVFFNPYHKNHLASSDYEGCVCIWDVNTGAKMINHQEHSKRVWSVVYNPAEPTMYASGSDDCTVKLWCTSRPHSIFKIDAKANVCSVRFHPVERHYLAYGSADHAIHYIDLRNPGQQLFELKGHRKAVSYVHFISTTEVISASTDSELKLWNVQKGQVLRTYRGHTNEKNFVGLTVSNDFISCGSEDNSVYVYCKQVSKPMLKYKFNTPSNLLMSGELESQLNAVSSGQGPHHHATHQPHHHASLPIQPHPQAPHQQPVQQTQPSQDATDFVSSVCWKKDSNLILAANSQGHIKLLKMC